MSQRKRKSSGSARENDAPKSSRLDKTNKAAIQRMLDDLDAEAEFRIKQMQDHCGSLVSSIQFGLNNQIRKLPKSIRTMPLEQFVKEYGGQVSAVVMQTAHKRQEELNSWVASTPRLRSSRKPDVLATPSSSRTKNTLPDSALKNPPLKTRLRIDTQEEVPLTPVSRTRVVRKPVPEPTSPSSSSAVLSTPAASARAKKTRAAKTSTTSSSSLSSDTEEPETPTASQRRSTRSGRKFAETSTATRKTTRQSAKKSQTGRRRLRQ